jgi:hypothetical protein
MYKGPIGRTKDRVLVVIKSMNISNWMKVAQNRDIWKRVDELVRNLYRLWCFIRRRRMSCSAL